MRLKVLDQFRHRLLGHLRALCEHLHGGSGVVEELEDGAVRGAYGRMPELGEASQHEVVDGYECLAQCDAEVCRALTTAACRNTD
jgi:hypothetical protein